MMACMRYFAVHVISSGLLQVEPGRKLPEDLLKLLGPDKIKKLLASGSIRESTSVPQTAPEDSSVPVQQNPDPKRWAFDPKSLEGKDLETLNMLVQDHVKKHGLAPVEPFETELEARFFLSKDRE